DFVRAIDRLSVRLLAEQRLAVGPPVVVIARAPQHRGGQLDQLANPLVLRLGTVIGDVAGDDHRVGRGGQPREISDDPSGALGTPLTRIDVDVADVRNQDHAPNVRAPGPPARRPKVYGWRRWSTRPA